MTTTRIILGAILGGIAMFLWSWVAHDVLPLGHAGVGELPNEQTVLAALQTGIGDKAGLYLFPGFGLGDNPTAAQKREAMEHVNDKLATNPSGLLMYHPAGKSFSFARLLLVEFATEFVEVLLVLVLLSMTRLNSYGCRVCFFVIGGVLAAISTNVSYWNWYDFPSVYIAAYMTIQIIGFLLAGLVAALVLGKGPQPSN